jgi:AcrR family transcriptional regulator
VGGTRSYRSELREESARRTRRLVADAARERFLADGYAETSVAAIARAAGVSAQTVYNAFGTKADLLKHVYDVTLVGDDEPVPFAERPEVVALYATPDARQFLLGYAGIGQVLLDRLGPLLKVVMAGAAGGNPDLVAHLDKVAAERLVGATMAARRVAELGGLRRGVSLEEARDAIWMLNSVEVWQLLTVARGWSDERYVAWLGRAMADAVLPR